MDLRCYQVLCDKNLDNVTLINLDDIENDKYKNLKKIRSFGEYCWTCTALTILNALLNFEIDHIVYLDADLFFYKDVSDIVSSCLVNSITITCHDFSDYPLKNKRFSGEYNVGFMVFKNDQNSIECLQWWKDKCEEWCYDNTETGLYGDQKYLDEFPKLFKSVSELEHTGVNVAPWNIKKRSEKNMLDLIVYHFSDFAVNNNKTLIKDFSFTIDEKGIMKFDKTPNTIAYKYIYEDYQKELQKVYHQNFRSCNISLISTF